MKKSIRKLLVEHDLPHKYVYIRHFYVLRNKYDEYFIGTDSGNFSDSVFTTQDPGNALQKLNKNEFRTFLKLLRVKLMEFKVVRMRETISRTYEVMKK